MVKLNLAGTTFFQKLSSSAWQNAHQTGPAGSSSAIEKRLFSILIYCKIIFRSHFIRSDQQRYQKRPATIRFACFSI